MKDNGYFITTAIAYPNGRPHIGHAYEMVAADALARHSRLRLRETFFLTGTDEHGLKMQQTALEMGVEPNLLATKNSKAFKELVVALDISIDDFIRTTEKRHLKSAKALWSRMLASSDIYKGHYEGWYSQSDEAFFDESELQTDSVGTKIAPTGSQVCWVAEPTYFFRLSAYTEKLLDFYEENPDFIYPKQRRNEVVSFVKSGLRDLSISRTTFDWGIKVPNDEEHVMYVWVDALTNYLSGLGFPDDKNPHFQKYWPAKLHVVGKDIIRFHAVFWPAFLWSANLRPPEKICAHGHLTANGVKMSKSIGNVVDPFPLIDLFGADHLRFFLLREVSFGMDGDFSIKKMISRNNSDLSNNIGNLVQRSLSMIWKHLNGKIPTIDLPHDQDRELLENTKLAVEKFTRLMDSLRIHEAIAILLTAFSNTNSYFAFTAPWELVKSDRQRFEQVLAVVADALFRLSICLLCIVPNSATKILSTLGFDTASLSIDDAKELKIPQSMIPHKPEPIFPKIDL